MELITWILIGIAALFFLILILKNIFNLKKVCVICLSVTLTWLALLTLYFLNIFADKIIIAILIGHTSLGIFYILHDKLKMFKLPYLLTSILIIYYILNGFVISSLYFILGLWTLFFLVYLFKSNRNISKLAKKILECCKKW